jgi:hypothetical protein
MRVGHQKAHNVENYIMRKLSGYQQCGYLERIVGFIFYKLSPKFSYFVNQEM